MRLLSVLRVVTGYTVLTAGIVTTIGGMLVDSPGIGAGLVVGGAVAALLGFLLARPPHTVKEALAWIWIFGP